jgi:hypothetical protein
VILEQSTDHYLDAAGIPLVVKTGGGLKDMPQLRIPASPIHAVYPHSRLAAAKVRLCVNFLAAKLKQQWTASVQGAAKLSDSFGDRTLVSDD